VPPAPPAVLTVSCAPRLQDDQEAFLLFGDQRTKEKTRIAVADPTLPSESEFEVFGAAGESFVVRLRADGIDSIPIDFANPLTFDPSQTVAFQ